jgi:hypothetical protein
MRTERPKTITSPIGLWLVDDNGGKLYPVRIRNRATGRIALP